MLMPDFPVWDAEKSSFKLELNPDFVPAVRERLEKKGLDQNAKVIVMCRSGDRSAASANLLAEAGFTNVYSIVEGFEGDMAKEGPTAGTRSVNGWKNAGLPWSYKLDREKMYGLQ
jgi:rhodanese-related sulfurtransferase